MTEILPRLKSADHTPSDVLTLEIQIFDWAYKPGTDDTVVIALKDDAF